MIDKTDKDELNEILNKFVLGIRATDRNCLTYPEENSEYAIKKLLAWANKYACRKMRKKRRKNENKK